jgi:hypothetical protein
MAKIDIYKSKMSVVDFIPGSLNAINVGADVKWHALNTKTVIHTRVLPRI